MLTICLLILIGYYLKKPVGELMEKLKGVESKVETILDSWFGADYSVIA